MFELWRLYNFGYIHGDITLNNLMINIHYPYIEDKLGKVIIIDFGATFEVPRLFKHRQHLPFTIPPNTFSSASKQIEISS